MSPVFQAFNLIVPEPPVLVVQVHDVGPLPYPVAPLAIWLIVEPLGMGLNQDRVGWGVVVDHVNHNLHAPRMDGLAEFLEVL